MVYHLTAFHQNFVSLTLSFDPGAKTESGDGIPEPYVITVKHHRGKDAAEVVCLPAVNLLRCQVISFSVP